MLDLADCEPPHCIAVIEAPAPSAAEAALQDLLRPLDEVIEQLTAITGLGLEAPDGAPAAGDLQRGRVYPAGAGFPVSYLTAGDPAARPIVFVHGSPSSAAEWGGFMGDVPEGLRYIAVDRPGFGDSGPEGAVPELARQAAVLAPFLRGRDRRKAVLVGYSYGGPVVLRAAIDNPERVGGIMLIGGAADPGQEDVHPLQRLVAKEILAQLLPRHIDNSNVEIMALKSELENMAAELEALAIPVTIVHGLRDGLVPPQNVAYLQRRLRQALPLRITLVEDADHFLPWSHLDTLKAALAQLVRDVAERERRG